MSASSTRPISAAAVAVLIGLAASAVGQEPPLRILAPAAGESVAGVTILSATIDHTDDEVASIAMYVDGTQVCELTHPPWECSWDAGRAARQWIVRMVATLTNGQRLTASLRTAQPEALFRVETSAVLVGVSVRDRRDRFVRGLEAGDFRVYDEGTLQEVRFFEADDWNTNVVLAIDMSGSMEPHLMELKRAVRAVLASIGPSDHVALAAFNANLFVLSPWEATPEARAEAVDGLSAWGTTAFYDALVASLDLLQRREGRRALIVFTDGDDTASLASQDPAERALLADNVLLYVVGYGDAARRPEHRSRLERLAARTGGRAIFVRNVDEIARALTAAMDDVRQQYTLGYRPEEGTPGEWRRIRVELDKGPYRIRAREGYVVGGGR